MRLLAEKGMSPDLGSLLVGSAFFAGGRAKKSRSCPFWSGAGFLLHPGQDGFRRSIDPSSSVTQDAAALTDPLAEVL
jgi:hypothetical protein